MWTHMDTHWFSGRQTFGVLPPWVYREGTRLPIANTEHSCPPPLLESGLRKSYGREKRLALVT